MNPKKPRKKPSTRPNGRPRTRHTEEATRYRLHTAMLYHMLRAEGVSPGKAHIKLGGKGRVEVACGEFKTDPDVVRIKKEKLTRAAWRDHMDQVMAKVYVNIEVAAYRRVVEMTALLRKHFPSHFTKTGSSVLGSAGRDSKKP